MELQKYWKELDDEGRAQYAERAVTTVDYLRVHLIPGKKIPRKPLMESLAQASNGNVSLAEVHAHFYPELTRGSAA